jgi:hypothetical protein
MWRLCRLLPYVGAIAVSASSLKKIQSDCTTKNYVLKEIPSKYPVIRQEVIDSYVNRILAEESLNINDIPDMLERHIYTFVIRLIFDSILRCIFSGLHELSFLGHHLHLEYVIENNPIDLPDINTIDKVALDALVDKLLQDKNLNIKFLPDHIERKLYSNVILIAFTCLQSVARGTKLDLVGHTIEISMAASVNRFENQIMKNLLKPSTISDEEIDRLLDEQIHSSSNGFIPNTLERPLFRTLYKLILRAVQEITSDLSLHLMGDKIIVRLLPDIHQADQMYPAVIPLNIIKRQGNIAESSNNTDGFALHHLVLAAGVGFVGALAIVASRK